MSNFAFLQSEWPQIYEAAARAEASVYPDPRAACFYARRAMELAVKWLYKADARLTFLIKITWQRFWPNQASRPWPRPG